MNTEAERISLHFKYCTLILVMVIIAVATDRWTAQKDFTVYLSNAATLTSLVLGLVAIFYSFISNDSLSKSLGSITTVSTELTETKAEISKYVDLANRATDESSKNTVLLKSASEGVEKNLVTLEVTLRAISEQNQNLQNLVSNLPTRLDQLESKVIDVAKSLGEKPQPSQSIASSAEISIKVIERFLQRPSLSYNLVTYAFVLSARTKTPIPIQSICQAIGLNQPNTINGFMMAMYAAQLLVRKVVSSDQKIYNITSIHPDLNRMTKPYIEKYIDEAYSDKPTEKAEWLQKLSNIEGLFPQQDLPA